MAGPSLRQLAIAHGTDKEGAHHYTAHYERHLGHLRDRPITLLEIGIGGYDDPASGGGSLRMWKAYFPRARIIGVDLHDKHLLAEDRIEIVQGDQGDPAFLEHLGATRGPFDVVIDDGSHINAHVIATFTALFPHMAPDGIYAIEDLQTSYWERGYGGSSGRDRAGTSMTFLHGLVDGLNYAELDVAGYEPTATDLGIMSVAFYHNLAFIQCGRNDEPSNFLPPHPRPAAVYVSRPRRTPAASNPGSKPAGNAAVRAARSAARAVVPAPLRRRIRAALAQLRGRDRRGG
jgi:hypothetical protein